MKTTISPHQILKVREWAGQRLSPVREVFMFHQDSGPVPETYRRLREALELEGIDRVVIGAFALAAHRLRRATFVSSFELVTAAGVLRGRQSDLQAGGR